MTRRTPFNGTSAARRRERLKAAAIERGADARAEVVSTEVLHRPTPSRVVLQCKRQVTPSVNRAVDTETEYHKQILAGAAAYVEHRISNKYQKVSNEAGRQIHAVQKMRGKSIPLV